MALTRKLLESMGIEADKVASIIEAHAETVDALKEKAEQYKADAEKVAKLTEDLNKIKAENKSLKSGEDWQAKYDELSAEYEGYKTEQANKELIAQKKTAYSKLLKDAGITESAIGLILKSADLTQIDLADGDIVNADKLKESLKTEYADFITNTQTTGAKTVTPPANDGNKVYTYEDISKMSRDQINANWTEISKSLAQNKN